MNEDDLARMEQLALMEQAAQQSQMPQTSSYYHQEQKRNLIEYELDFTPELEEIKRLLRCDVLVRDERGNESWKENEDKTTVFFNELGVNDIIRNIVILVNKNKALSNYDVEEVNKRVKQIKHEIRTLIYNNYELYGMDNDYKMNNYSMIVLSVGSVIEDVYRRAMNGETHKGLAEQRLVSQSENVAQPMAYPMQTQTKPSGLGKLMPWNWGK